SSCLKNDLVAINPETNWITPEGGTFNLGISESLFFQKNTVDTSFYLEAYNFYVEYSATNQYKDAVADTVFINNIGYSMDGLWLFSPSNVDLKISALFDPGFSKFNMIMYYDNFSPDSLFYVLDNPAAWEVLDTNLYSSDYDATVEIEKFGRLYIFLEQI
ncbi:MAG: hypothetical protein AB8B72_00905, partial [Crocinitomicaceae bacterium]